MIGVDIMDSALCTAKPNSQHWEEVTAEARCCQIKTHSTDRIAIPPEARRSHHAAKQAQRPLRPDLPDTNRSPQHATREGLGNHFAGAFTPTKRAQGFRGNYGGCARIARTSRPPSTEESARDWNTMTTLRAAQHFRTKRTRLRSKIFSCRVEFASLRRIFPPLQRSFSLNTFKIAGKFKVSTVISSNGRHFRFSVVRRNRVLADAHRPLRLIESFQASKTRDLSNNHRFSTSLSIFANLHNQPHSGRCATLPGQ